MKLLPFVFLVLCSFGHGAEVVTSEGIHITSETTTANLKEGVITYEGNVVVKHDHIEFRSDRIVERREDGVRSVVIATGNPAVYIDKLAQSGEVSRGVAMQVEYIASESKVFLKNYELEDSAGNRHSGKRGVYVLDDS